MVCLAGSEERDDVIDGFELLIFLRLVARLVLDLDLLVEGVRRMPVRPTDCGFVLTVAAVAVAVADSDGVE